MKKFHFSLQTVHNLREAKREDAERGLVKAATAAQDAAAHLEGVKYIHTSATQAFAVRLRETEIDPQEAALSVAYLAMLVGRRREAHAKLKELEAKHESQRELTVNAARDAKATARLRERQHERHTQQVARSEQEMLDEMATLAQARRSMGDA